MEIIWTRTKTIVSLGLLALTLAGWAVKHYWYPDVEERFFQLDYQRLQTAPGNVFIFRSTHFSESRRSGAMAAHQRDPSGIYDQKNVRLLARDVGLAEIVALAYQCSASHVALPSGATTNAYDLLLTKPHALDVLKKYLRRKFGYTASWQDHSTSILALHVTTRNAAMLKPSPDDAANQRTEYLARKLHFHHAPIQQIIQFIERAFNRPVQDQTDLTGYYDFEFPWDGNGSCASSQAAIKKSLADLGLALEPDTAMMQMMVVERAR